MIAKSPCQFSRPYRVVKKYLKYVCFVRPSLATKSEGWKLGFLLFDHLRLSVSWFLRVLVETLGRLSYQSDYQHQDYQEVEDFLCEFQPPDAFGCLWIHLDVVVRLGSHVPN